MKTRQEIEDELKLLVKSRREYYVNTLQHGGFIDEKLDAPNLLCINQLCWVLGNFTYNAFTHELKEDELPKDFSLGESRTIAVKGVPKNKPDTTTKAVKTLDWQ